MKLDAFFNRRPVFTLAEFSDFLRAHGSANRRTQDALLRYHRRHGRVLFLRRGLYAVVPLGVPPQEAPIDPYLLASRLAPEAVLSHHTALEFHGKAYSVFHTFFYLADRPRPVFEFRGTRFRAVRFPASLARADQALFGVEEASRLALTLRVTSLERTLVDVLDRPDLAGGPEEVWRSLESVEFFDLDRVIRYAELLGNATAAAKVGFFLEQHREALSVRDEHLRRLEKLRPGHCHYFDRRRASGRFLARWNLVVPAQLLDRSFEEVL